MGFEVYESKTLARSHVPVVTLQKRGAISINRAGYEAVGEPEHVLLLRDVDRNLIAVKPAAASDVRGRVVRLLNPARGSGPVVVAASDFVRDVGIDTSVARRWVAQLDEGMLVVDLNAEGVVAVSNSGRARTEAADAAQPGAVE